MENGADVVLSLMAEMLVLFDIVLAIVSVEGDRLDLLHCEVFIEQDRKIADDDSTDWHA